MINQTNEAAERSAHVTRGEKPAPAEWPVVRMPDGTWKLKSVLVLENRIAELEATLIKVDLGAYQMGLYTGKKTQTARIAELEAALRSIASNTCCDRCQEAALVARAALEGGKS